jgi:hypothetical protein
MKNMIVYDDGGMATEESGLGHAVCVGKNDIDDTVVKYRDTTVGEGVDLSYDGSTGAISWVEDSSQ